MIPWQFVKSVVTAESPQSSKAFGLMSNFAQPVKQRETRKGRNDVK
jgi:hypothetical protein